MLGFIGAQCSECNKMPSEVYCSCSYGDCGSGKWLAPRLIVFFTKGSFYVILTNCLLPWFMQDRVSPLPQKSMGIKSFLPTRNCHATARQAWIMSWKTLSRLPWPFRSKSTNSSPTVGWKSHSSQAWNPTSFLFPAYVLDEKWVTHHQFVFG